MSAYARAFGHSAEGALDAAARLARIERLARLLDTAFGIPGTRFRFGFDAIADAIPVIGQIAPQAISAFIVYEAWKLGASRDVLIKMIGNVALDTAIGTVPAAGILGDALFKANIRNVALLRAHLNLPANSA
jgi:hypothetical protein